MKRLGLIGHPLLHSFSPRYFEEKWRHEGIHGFSYELFDLPELPGSLPNWWCDQRGLIGLNVTIPYKSAILFHIEADQQSEQVQAIGAANTIVMDPSSNALRAENTDWRGFLDALDREQVSGTGRPALILGNGGASRAVRYALEQIGVDHAVAHRAAGPDNIEYAALKGQMETYGLIVNTTPLGTYPKEHLYPPLPYEEITPEHYYFDLVYRPRQTAAMKICASRGAYVQSGYGMLVAQAEYAWDIWSECYQIH